MGDRSGFGGGGPETGLKGDKRAQKAMGNRPKFALCISSYRCVYVQGRWRGGLDRCCWTPSWRTQGVGRAGGAEVRAGGLGRVGVRPARGLLLFVDVPLLAVRAAPPRSWKETKMQIQQNKGSELASASRTWQVGALAGALPISGFIPCGSAKPVGD